MRKLHVRELLSMTEDEVWKLPLGLYEVTTEQPSVITMRARQLISSWYFLCLHRDYPLMKILDHHIFTGDAFSKSQNLTLYSNAMYEHFLRYGDGEFRESLWLSVMEHNNYLYNAITGRCREYITSGNILDFIDIAQHPDIAAANEKATARLKAGRGDPQQVVDEVYGVIKQVVFHCPTLDNNPVVRALRIGLTSIDQPNQIVGPRGFMTDVDSNIFPVAIWDGFLAGLTQFVDILKESCSAKKAATFSKHPLRIVEWFNRKMQLICENVEHLVPGTCNTTKTLKIHVDSRIFPTMEGKFYKTENGGMSFIHSDSKELIGKTLEIYSPLTCGHRGSNSVCYRCFGLTSLSIPHGSNLGHVSSTELCEPGSQLVLSVKHYDGSSKVTEIRLRGEEEAFMSVGTKTGTLLFRKHMAKMKPKLVLEVGPSDAMGAGGLNSLDSESLVSNIAIQRITSFKNITLRIPSPTGYIEHTLSTSVGKRIGSLSREMLDYIRKERFTIDESGNYVIDLHGWCYDDVAVVLPLKHVNMLDIMGGIENFIRSVKSSVKTEEGLDHSAMLCEYSCPSEAMMDFCHLVSERLRVNWAHLEVIALAHMCPADDPEDYRIPDISRPSEFRVYDDIMQNRSHAQTYAYQYHDVIVQDPLSYTRKTRDAHILDPVVLLH